MRHESRTCDWCESRLTATHRYYGTRHVGGYATWEGARYDFDFCDDDCLSEWMSHDRQPKRLATNPPFVSPRATGAG